MTLSNNTEQDKFDKTRYSNGPLSLYDDMIDIIQKKVDEIASQYAEDREQFCRGMLATSLEKQGCFFGQWHKYPEEKPADGTYLVTCKDFDGAADLCFGDYKYGTWVHCPYLDDQVIAWAELPKPYEG